MQRHAVFFALWLLFFSNAWAAIPSNSMKIYAVTSDGGAISAQLTLKVIPNGSGRVWSSVDPLVGTSTQSAERTALTVAKNYSGEWNRFDYLFDINSSASLVEGPSAGAAMAALLIASLEENHFPKNVGLTGTISEDGTVGPVGGVLEKSREASNNGIQLFLIPKGESRQVVRESGKIQSVDLTQYAFQQWGMKVVEVQTIDDVMRWSFSDIDSIDVNQQKPLSNGPEFIPSPIPHARSLQPMQSLTKRYLKDSLQKISSARTALSTTLLDDTSLISALLNALNEAEDTVNKSQVLFDQNYLYSSANFAFLSRVNASLIEDIAENPSLLQSGNALFQSQLNSLGNDLRELESQLDYGVPIDALEWYIASQERLSWAELNYDRLSRSQDIVIQIEDGESTSNPSSELERVQELEFSKEWANISKEFHAMGKNSAKRVPLDDFMKENAQQGIVQAENALSARSGNDSEDIQRRLDAAKLEFSKGWYVSASFDARSALALMQGESESNGKDLKTLEEMLSSKILSVEQKMASSKNDFVWANLYLDHARYYLEQSRFNQKQGQNSSAVSSLKSGLGLAYLAEAVFEVAEQSYNYYRKIPSSAYLPAGAGATVTITPNGGSNTVAQAGFLLLLIAVVTLLLLVLVIVSTHHFSMAKKYAIATQLTEMQKQKLELQSLRNSNQIDEETYRTRLSELSEKEGLLELQRKAKSANLIALDRLRAEMTALERTLRELKVHYREGLVVEEDYQQAFKDLEEKLSHIQKKIAERKSPTAMQTIQPMQEKKPKPKTISQQLKAKKNSKTLESIAREAKNSAPKNRKKK